MANVSRRNFLQGSMAAAAAPPPHGPPMPAVAGAQGIIDTHVYLAHWPARRMDCDETPELVTMLRQLGVVQAWAGSFDALIHKNLGAVNSRVAEQCSRHGAGLLVPFGSVNPKLPDWQEEVRRCQEEFRMPGIRVHPTYHDYVLTDPAFVRLLQVAAERGLLIQIAAWMEDDRCPNPLLRVPILNLDVLPDLLARITNVKVEMLNAFVHVSNSNQLPQRLSKAQVVFDFAMLDALTELANLIAAAGIERVVFGSYSPMFYFQSALLKVRESALSEVQSRAVFSGNARRLLPAGTSTNS